MKLCVLCAKQYFDAEIRRDTQRTAEKTLLVLAHALDGVSAYGFRHVNVIRAVLDIG